jgi:hypothetical protein
MVGVGVFSILVFVRDSVEGAWLGRGRSLLLPEVPKYESTEYSGHVDVGDSSSDSSLSIMLVARAKRATRLPVVLARPKTLRPLALFLGSLRQPQPLAGDVTVVLNGTICRSLSCFFNASSTTCGKRKRRFRDTVLE